jgi:hypothetical protein
MTDMSAHDIPVPAGCRRDAAGRFVPEAIIPDHEILRDDLVQAVVAEIEAEQRRLLDLKARLFVQLDEHVALIATDYGADVTGRSGGLRMDSYDGLRRIERTSAQRITVGEEIIAAESLVRRYLARETSGASAAVRALVDRAFARDPKTGELRPSRLLDFAGVDIDDDDWRACQRAIRDAMHPAGAATYIRAYRRDDPSQPWELISLDFASLPTPTPTPVAAARAETADA